jgi:hypothetical protein
MFFSDAAGRDGGACKLNTKMKLERDTPQILNCRRLPARLTRHETASLLNLHDADSVSVLVEAKLLKPLGHRTKRSQMWFATCEILRLSEDIKWLGRATDAARDRATTNRRPGEKEIAAGELLSEG